MRRIHPTLVAVAGAIALLGACGGGDDGGSGVASLGTGATGTGDAAAATSTTAPTDPAEAAAAYAECMREHGIDMPDPQITGDGGITMVVGGEPADGEGNPPPDDEETQAAAEECRPLLEDAVGSVEIDPEQQAEMREQLLEYAQCMRDQGVDFPDPVFGDGGMVTARVGGDEPMTEADRQALADASEACSVDGGGLAIGVAPAGAAPEAGD